MRVVIDTTVLVSALLIAASLPAHLITLWRLGLFDLLTADKQLDELIRVTRYSNIRDRLPPILAGRLINQLRELAITVSDLPTVAACADPYDNYLLAISSAGKADFLITGDKADLLSMGTYDGTKITTVRDFLSINGQLSKQFREEGAAQ